MKHGKSGTATDTAHSTPCSSRTALAPRFLSPLRCIEHQRAQGDIGSATSPLVRRFSSMLGPVVIAPSSTSQRRSTRFGWKLQSSRGAGSPACPQEAPRIGPCVRRTWPTTGRHLLNRASPDIARPRFRTTLANKEGEKPCSLGLRHSIPLSSLWKQVLFQPRSKTRDLGSAVSRRYATPVSGGPPRSRQARRHSAPSGAKGIVLPKEWSSAQLTSAHWSRSSLPFRVSVTCTSLRSDSS